MQFFDPLLRSGEYLVIEDADILFTGQDRERDGGPARAIAEFLRDRGDTKSTRAIAINTATTSPAIRTVICAKNKLR